jgi:glycosyltransferase involved in cell wall biosynthesis
MFILTQPAARRNAYAQSAWRFRKAGIMRIALFTETFLPRTDGMVTRLTHTVAALREAGDDVLVVAPHARGLPREYRGARVVGAPSLPLPFYRGFRVGLPFTLGLDVELAEFAPDIIHIANPILVGLAGLSYARRYNTPLVASYHTHLALYARRYRVGALEPVIWAYMRALHCQARLNLCTSRPALALLRDRGFPRLAFWAPGVDAELFHPRRRSVEWRERLSDGRPDAALLLYVGRLANEKGLERLAPALAALPGCHLALVGEGPAERRLRQIFADLPVTFVGALYGEELAAAYASADIFAFPSSTETLGLAVIEAMAAGLPVVGARRGGVPDIVLDGATGLLFDPDTAGDLERALRALVADEEMRERMALAARLRAQRWTWAASTAGLRDHYRAVLATAAVPAPTEDAAADPSSAPSV